MEKYILGIDQSTQGTKALIFNSLGKVIGRKSISHKQLINEKGWVSHDPEEIYRNIINVVKEVIQSTGISKEDIEAVGISNQRETSLIWDKYTGKPLAPAIVWQCSRATELCKVIEKTGASNYIKEKTGMPLSPYFPASKFAWLLENIPGASKKAAEGSICFGTIDTWMIYCLTKGKSYKTDYSNASRTQLFDIYSLTWNREICDSFGIYAENLPEVCDSDSNFGMTDFDGLLNKSIPIHAVMGDSHGALFGHGCLKSGMVKTTYGTGSSIMLNIGEKPVKSNHGVVTSLAWGRGGKVNYVLEGNINYTGAVITWLKDDMKIIDNPQETEELSMKANKEDTACLVPAFTGLGAPYWESEAKAALVGITRTTGKNEIVKAAVECIGFQIFDVIKAMEKDSGIKVAELMVDGAPTKNKYLMQFQSDILESSVRVPSEEELSAIGVAYAAGISIGMWPEDIFESLNYKTYKPLMKKDDKNIKCNNWMRAVNSVLRKEKIAK